jgi:hypothetical protein
MFDQNTSHDILVNIYVKCLRYDQRHARAAELRILAFELNDDTDELFGGSFGTRFRLSPSREEHTVVPTNQTLAKAQKRRWPDGDGDFVDPAMGEKQRTQAQEHAIKRVEVWPSPLRAGDDEQLLLEKQILGEYRLCAARPEEPGDDREQMYEEQQGILHSELTSELTSCRYDLQYILFR